MPSRRPGFVSGGETGPSTVNDAYNPNNPNYRNRAPDPNHLGVNRQHDDYAARTAAAIDRSRWEDWKQNFLPLLQQEAATVNNPAYREQMIGQAMDLAQAGQDRSDAAFQRDLREMGLSLTEDQQRSRDRKLDLSGSLAMVDAGNRTRRNLEDRDLRLAGGALATRNEARSGGSLGATLGI